MKFNIQNNDLNVLRTLKTIGLLDFKEIYL